MSEEIETKESEWGPTTFDEIMETYRKELATAFMIPYELLEPEPAPMTIKVAPHDWQVSQRGEPAEHHNCRSAVEINSLTMMPPCTPTRRDLLTGGLTEIWNGLKQVAGALKP